MFDCALVLEKSVIEFDMCIWFAIYKVFDFESFRAFILQLDEEFVALEKAYHCPHKSISDKVDGNFI